MVPRFKGQCNTPAFAITEIWIVRKQANVRAYRRRSNKYAKSPGYWGSDSVGYGPGLPAPQDDRGFAPCHQRSPQRDLPNPTDLRKITFVHVRHHRRSFPFLTRNFADVPSVFSMFNPTGKAARSQFAGLLRNVPDISSAYRSNRRNDRCGANVYRKSRNASSLLREKAPRRRAPRHPVASVIRQTPDVSLTRSFIPAYDSLT